jgi:Flp pilus assembly protein TadG
MTKQKIATLPSLRSSAARFARAEDGNISLLTSMAVIPLMVFIGVGIDYSRILNAQTGLQASIDSAVLTLAQTGKSMTAQQLQTQAQTLVSASFYNPSSSGLNVYVTQSGTSAMSYNIKATINFQPSMLGLIGYTSIPVSASATAQSRSNARNRIALVLDNSGSMSSAGKMTALKGAAKSFLTQLQNATTTTADVYVSIVPFVDVVNVDYSNLSANWIDWTEWDNGDFSISYSRHSSRSNRSTYWSGCVADRGNQNSPSSGNYDTNVTAPSTSNTATLFPATYPGACPEAVLPLTNDWTALSNKVDAMVANGNTNQAIGIAHGWMSLVGGGPYPAPPVEDPNYTYQKTVIVLSDGLNTADRWYSYANSIDARQTMTCANMKTAKVVVYTIQVNTSNDPTSSVLQSCASDASKFYQISSSSQMPTIFSDIAGKINQLTLTQ